MAAPPSTFKSGIDIKLALSAAFSTQFNSRSLEANFSPPWIATLKDALSFSSRLSLATEPYLTIPGRVINQMEQSEDYNSITAERDMLLSTISELPQPGPETTNRRSGRLQALDSEKRRKYDEIQRKAEQLTETVEGIVDDMVAHVEVALFFNEISFSVDNESDHDNDARDLRPDISVAHIIGGSVRVPTREDAKRLASEKTHEAIRKKELSLLSQHKARAGVAVVHRCTPLIGEFKRVVGRAEIDIVHVAPSNLLDTMHNNGPVRQENKDEDADDPWPTGVSEQVAQAISDLMYYTAIYFLIHPQAVETVALASSGPLWMWSCIKRDQPPKFEWLSGQLVKTRENFKLRDVFNNQFGRTCFVLTTPESDIEINKMMKEISRITENCECNLPLLPTDFDFKLIPDTPCASYLATASKSCEEEVMTHDGL